MWSSLGVVCVVDFLLKRRAIQFQILNTFPRVADYRMPRDQGTRVEVWGKRIEGREYQTGQLTMLSRNFTRRWFQANEFDSIVSSFLQLLEAPIHRKDVPQTTTTIATTDTTTTMWCTLVTTPLTCFWQPNAARCAPVKVPRTRSSRSSGSRRTSGCCRDRQHKVTPMLHVATIPRRVSTDSRPTPRPLKLGSSSCAAAINCSNARAQMFRILEKGFHEAPAKKPKIQSPQHLPCPAPLCPAH